MNLDSFDDLTMDDLVGDTTLHVNSHGDDDPLEKLFSESDLNESLRKTRATTSDTSLYDAILGRDRDGAELEQLMASRARTLGKGCTPPAELEELAKGNAGLRKAAGCIAHACQKSLTVSEALAMTTDLFR